MKQPVSKKNSKINITNKKKSVKKKVFKRREFKKSPDASDLDGSGLETFFRINVLDKLGVKYDQQFEAKSIGRFYDFYLPDSRILIECDGDYFHKNPEIYSEAINKMQKYNVKIDEAKNKWALINGYVLFRFWETDIRKNPGNIILFLKERLNIQNKVIVLNESKKDGSFYRVAGKPNGL